MQQPSTFDDDEFSVLKCKGMAKPKLLEMQALFQARIDELTNRLCDDHLNEDDYHEVSRTINRKRRQIQWIQARLAAIKDANRQRALGRQRRAQLRKTERQDLFHKVFFLLCQAELEERDFKELCEMARDKTAKLWAQTHRDGSLQPTHRIGETDGQPFIECLVCKMKSYNRGDIEHRYCGNCHEYHPILRGALKPPAGTTFIEISPSGQEIAILSRFPARK